MTNTLKTERVRVTGRVQGVSFRVWTRDESLRLGLAGWVRNEADGSVSALLQGPASAVDAMTGLLWRGPRDALVEAVSTEQQETEEIYTAFTIQH